MVGWAAVAVHSEACVHCQPRPDVVSLVDVNAVIVNRLRVNAAVFERDVLIVGGEVERLKAVECCLPSVFQADDVVHVVGEIDFGLCVPTYRPPAERSIVVEVEQVSTVE